MIYFYLVEVPGVAKVTYSYSRRSPHARLVLNYIFFRSALPGKFQRNQNKIFMSSPGVPVGSLKNVSQFFGQL